MDTAVFVRPLLLAAASVALASAQTPVDFARDVQPVFEKSCYNCHGPKMQMGGLRLDTKAGSRTVTAGKLEESTLYQRVIGANGQPRMPMGSKALPADQLETIKRWIEAGGQWPETSAAAAEAPKHWAFVAPVRPKSGNSVDDFVRARLDKEGLKMAPVADKVTLLRRLSLDLIGLPPTIEEVDAFLADTSKNAYEKQVDRLLASPHYGERWGRLWLDAARYADSDGFEKDKARQVWAYRDWVINALNKDMPYDRFIIEQVAGDMLPNATQEQMVATGFLRNSMINEEGGADPEQFRMEAMFDRMDAIGKAVLGVTVQCAQCHTHKFDPIPHEEYYRMFAFLNNSHESAIPVYTTAELKKRDEVLRQVAAAVGKMPSRKPAPTTGTWTVVRPEVDDISTGGAKYLPQPDGSLLQAGYAPTKHKVKLTFKAENVSAIRLELMNDPNLPLGGPGRSVLGTAAVSEFEVEAGGSKVKVVGATADISLPEAPLLAMYDDKSGKKRVTGPVAFAIDGNGDTAWGHDAGPVLRNLPREAVFTLEKPVSGEITVYLNQRHGGWNSDDNQNCNLGRFRLSVSPDGEAKARDRQEPMSEELAKIWSQHPEGSSQLVLREREERRPTFLLTRGDFLKPGKQVQPGVLSFLHPLPEGETPTRLTFAKWLADRKSPTTARAIVNRVWQAYFGQGLVATPEDFGRQSEPPSHPELLDWMAVELMDRGWSLKTLHRSIVLSETYRQSSTVSPEFLSKDPYNRLLARGPRQRVDAEVVRDIALRASGLLTPTVGGPSVFPPAPDFLFQPPASYGPKNWPEAKGEDRYRRALYTFRFRSVPYPMLQTFDAPNADTACVRRAKSNTPLQALVTLNEPLFLESARALAAKTLTEGGSTDAARVEYAFRRVLARKPEASEKDALLGFLAKQRMRLTEGWLSAPQLAGGMKPPTGTTPVQVAAWTAVARAIFNLDEAITKE